MKPSIRLLATYNPWIIKKKIFPELSWKQKSRKYLENGYRPKDDDCICIGCKHSYVDEPNTNQGIYEIYQKELREFEAKWSSAPEEAKKSGDRLKVVKKPRWVCKFYSAIAIKCIV
jgi:hypothetical protein